MKLSEEQRQLCREAFDSFDHNKDGSLSSEELEVAMLEAGIEVNKRSCQDIVDTLDLDGDRRLSFEEFLEFISLMSQWPSIRPVFKKHDKNDDGLLSRDELEKALGELNAALGHLDRVLQAINKDEQEHFNFKELVHILKQIHSDG